MGLGQPGSWGAAAFGSATVGVVLFACRVTAAQGEPSDASDAGQPSSRTAWTAHGHVEAYYEWNFHRPANHVNHHRAYDSQHNAFAVQNAVLGTEIRSGRAGVRMTVQSGAMPQVDGTSLGPAPPLHSESHDWQYLKEASVGYEVQAGNGLALEAGLFEWPMGLESSAVHENWCWSRSNLYLAMPSRFAGARATYPASGQLNASFGVFNSWTGLTENNEEKTFSGGLRYEVPASLRTGLRYIGGVERDPDAPEGRPWRHVVGAYVQSLGTESITLGLEGNGGWEATALGTTWWVAAALEVRVHVAKPLSFAARLDGIRQLAGERDGEAAMPVLFVGPGVGSGTMTVEIRPQDGVSMMVEMRRDQGGSSQFFRGEILGTGSEASPYEPNSMWQQTVLVGATAWL